MNVQKQYHERYVDKLLDTVLIQYLIKCTNYNDPIIKTYTDKYPIPASTDNNINNILRKIDELIREFIPSIAVT